MPAQDDLPRGLAVTPGDGNQRWVLQQAESAARKRGLGGDDDALLAKAAGPVHEQQVDIAEAESVLSVIRFAPRR